MPHCIIECSNNISLMMEPKTLLLTVHRIVEKCGICSPNSVKSRVFVAENYIVNNTNDDFIHITITLLPGRTDEQKKILSTELVSCLHISLPSIQSISVIFYEIDVATHSNIAAITK